MIKYFLYCIIFVFCSNVLSMHHEEIFLKANKHYNDERYCDAHALYDMIEPKTSAVWHNKGNCFFHENKFSQALYAWRNAFKGASWSDKVRLQAQMGNVCRLMGRVDKRSMHYLSFFDRIIATLPFLFWQLTFLLCWFLSFYASIFFIRRGSKLILGVLIFLCFVCYLFLYVYQSQKPRLFVTQKTPLYIGPDRQYHSYGYVDEGDEYSILDMKQGMAKVRTQHHVGWLSSEHYKHLTP